MSSLVTRTHPLRLVSELESHDHLFGWTDFKCPGADAVPQVWAGPGTDWQSWGATPART